MNLSPAKRRRAVARTKDFVRFVRGVVNEFLTDNCPHLAASISYYVLFCLFPLTLAAVSIVGYLSNDEGIQTKVIEAISNFVPPVEEDFIAGTIKDVTRNWAATGIIAVVALLWGGSAVFSALRKALNAAWGIRTPRPFFVERLMELGMMIGVGILLTASFAMTAGVTVARQVSDDAIGGFFGGAIFWGAVRVLITAGLAFLTFLMLYKYIPNTRVRWGDVWGGALLAAVAFEGTKSIFVWYVADHNDYRLLYGEVIGTIIALLVFVYVSAIIFLFCAKLTAVYSRHRTIAPARRAFRARRRVSNRVEPPVPVPGASDTGYPEPRDPVGNEPDSR